jgi:hypothetical protein
MTDIKTNARIVVEPRVGDVLGGHTFTADDLRRNAQREPDKYIFDEEAGELLLTTCLAMSDKGQVHLINKGEGLELSMGYDHEYGPYDPGYILIDDLDDAIALLQATKQEIRRKK